MNIKRLLKSFKYACRGLRFVWSTQQNMRIHIICAVLVLTLAPFFHVSWKEFLLLCVVTMMVLFAEIINTAMEVVVDLVTDGKHHEYAKVVKDVAAGAVLLTSSLALFVGIMVFGAKVICFFK